MKILLAEDDRRNADMIAAPLRKDGFSVTIAEDGKQALDHLRRESYDVLITDWMMPRMDGIALILRVRETVQPMPYIIMVTALNSRKARAHALDSGADDFLSKPISGRRVLRSVRTGLARCRQPAPEMKPQPSGASFAPAAPPPFVGLVIAASTGGPGALPRILGALPRRERAAGFIVQHAPTRMLESLAARLQPSCPLRIVLARDGLPCSPGDIYLAPGDRQPYYHHGAKG